MNKKKYYFILPQENLQYRATTFLTQIFFPESTQPS